MPKPYEQRRLLRTLERTWTRFEALLNRLTSTREDKPGGLRPNFNPLYHLDTLGIFLLVVLLLTGIYLTVVYRPGADRAYQSLEIISATWFGSLMRSIHRYASDGLLIVIILHAFKTLLSDRFWGSRWLSWVSGMAVLLLTLVIGVMGYFLIWDQPAQWLAEYFMGFLSGPIILTFASPHSVSGAFGFFVIVLFLHVFLSLLIVGGLLIHEMRLRRPKVWSPRWVMIGAMVAFTVFSFWQPVSSQPPANLARLVETTTIDLGYMGFLPLSIVYGRETVWLISLLILGLITALPWLAKGKHVGPVQVIDADCTGCSICAKQCPYNAIEINLRDDPDAKYPSLAFVDPNMCTGCGICIGDCAPDCIELAELPIEQVVASLEPPLRAAREAGEAPLVVFACQRHAALETVPDASQAVVYPIPCSGMMQAEWARDSLTGGARAIVLLSCPEHDCGYREGPGWLDDRMNRGRNRSMLGKQAFPLQLAPGDRGGFRSALARLDAGAGGNTPGGQPRAISLTAGLVILVAVLALSLLAEWPVSVSTTESVLRIALSHRGEIRIPLDIEPDVLARLPEGVSPEEAFGGERYPVRMRLEIDGELVAEWEYEPTGLRNEGKSYGLENLSITPGSHLLELWLMDDGESWRAVFSEQVEVEDGEVVILSYDDEHGDHFTRQ